MNNIESVQNVRNSIFDNKKRIIKQFPCWDPEKDARITVFSKLINVCNSTQLSFIFMNFHLVELDWWKQIPKIEISSENSKIYVDEYDMFTKIGVVQLSFSSIESAFRLYVKSLDSSACNNGTAEFKSIYSWLLKRTDLQSHENLLDLLRLTRNTIHNNGVYFHKSGSNESISYKDEDYNFKIGSPVNFVTWNFIFELIRDVEDLIIKVVKSDVINEINQIEDPFAN